MQDFRNLNVWQKSHQLAIEVYQADVTFQTRHAATSISANIAEGCRQGSDSDQVRFIHIAIDSANELEHNLLLSKDIGYLDNIKYEKFANDVMEIKRLLTSFITELKDIGNQQIKTIPY